MKNPTGLIVGLAVALTVNTVIVVTCLTTLIRETREISAAHRAGAAVVNDILDQQEQRIASIEDVLHNLEGRATAIRSGQQENGVQIATLAQWVQQIHDHCWFLPPAARSVGVAALP